MGVWIAISAGLLVAGVIGWRWLLSRRSRIDAGEVSQSWIVEHRADNPQN
jgi:hypothetical protein